MNQGKLPILVHESIIILFHILEFLYQIEILILSHCTLFHIHIHLSLKMVSFKGQAGVFKLEFLDGSPYGAGVEFPLVYQMGEFGCGGAVSFLQKF